MRDKVKQLRQIADFLEEQEIEQTGKQNEIAQNIAGLMVDLDDLQKKLDVAEYELGRRDRKIENQEKTIGEQRQKIWGLEEVQQMDMAIIAAVVKTIGKINITQDMVNAALAAKIKVQSQYNAETRTYTLKIEE